MPPEIVVIPVKPLTCWAPSVAVLSPLPNCPLLLSPQHQTLPLLLRAQKLAALAAISLTPVSVLLAMSTTVTALAPLLSLPPSPRVPLLSSPQHCTCPVVCSAQLLAALTATLLAVILGTCAGSAVLPPRLVLSPVWPFKSLPQHHTVPPVRIAQICVGPTPSCVTPYRCKITLPGLIPPRQLVPHPSSAALLSLPQQ